VANTLKLLRNGDVGFIVWLGRFAQESSASEDDNIALKLFALALTESETCPISFPRRLPRCDG